MKLVLTTLLASTALMVGAQTPAQMQKMQAAMDAKKPAGADALPTDNGRPHRTPERVFATYEDMVADKPIDGITLDLTNYKGYQKKSETIALVENGTTREVDIKDVNYWGFTGSDGGVRRIFEGESYSCWALGDKHCYYQGRRNYNMETGNYYMRDWVSAGPNAPIEEGKRLCEDIIEASSFKDAFKKAKPKREMKDSVNGYQEKQMMWYVDFINRINGESAVK